MRGNVLDMAIGIILGIAFGAIISSLVNDVIMPPLGLVLGNVDFANLFVVLKEGSSPGPYPSVAAAKEAGAVTVNYGLFINTIINFILAAFAMFLLIKAVNQMQRKEEQKAPPAPALRECPYCISMVPLKATRCPHCTSELKKA